MHRAKRVTERGRRSRGIETRAFERTCVKKKKAALREPNGGTEPVAEPIRHNRDDHMHWLMRRNRRHSLTQNVNML